MNRLGQADADYSGSYMLGSVSKSLNKCTSKEIRLHRCSQLPIRSYKIGLELTEKEALNWGFRMTKLTSVKHKSTILRIAHGDVYTKEKLQRFGLINENKCPRCDDIETLDHKFVSCKYIKRIWQETERLLREGANPNPIKLAMGASLQQSLTNLTLKAEILTKILAMKDDQSYLIHPKHFVKMAVKSVAIKETRKEIRNDLRALL